MINFSGIKRVAPLVTAVAFSFSLAIGLVPAPAKAAFPGTSGKIAFETQVNQPFDGPRTPSQVVETMNADGTDRTVHTPDWSSSFNHQMPSWSADGSKLVFTDWADAASEIMIMDANTGFYSPVTSNSEYEMSPSFSPDGSMIVYVKAVNDNLYALYTMSSSGGSETSVTGDDVVPAGTTVRYGNPKFSPDGNSLAYRKRVQDNSSDVTYIIKRDLQTSAEVVLDTITQSVNNFDGGVDWSPDGTQIVYGGANGEIYVVNASGDPQPQELTHGITLAQGPAWSPDGTQIVLKGYNSASNSYDLYVMNANGTNAHPITNTEEKNENLPSWQSVAAPQPTDTVKPTVTISSPLNGANIPLGSSATASYSCDDNVAVVSCVGTLANGASLDTSTVGEKTFTVTAKDAENNETTVTVTYSITYKSSGLMAPLNSDEVNKAKAGSNVPVKFRLTDASGNPISTSSSFKSVTSSPTACNSSEPSDVVEEAASNSGLQYLGDGYWQYNWKTPKSYAGTCRIVSLNLADGSHTTVKFQF